MVKLSMLALLLVCILASPCFAQARKGSAEAQQKIQEFIDKVKAKPAKQSPPSTTPLPGGDSNAERKDTQGVRDRAVAARAVVEYVMTKEKMDEDEKKLVRMYATSGVKKLGARSPELAKFLDREEVREWMKAEKAYASTRE